MSSIQSRSESGTHPSRFPGNADLVGGRIGPSLPSGRRPNRIAGRIFRSLDDFATRTGRGEAYTANMGYTVADMPTGRQTFTPDASYFAGPFTGNPMEMIQGPPTFAADVRGEYDSGPAAEAERAARRADYFAAGTLIVWDVDPLGQAIHIYQASQPNTPIIRRAGEQADAGEALPGWSVAVDWILS